MRDFDLDRVVGLCATLAMVVVVVAVAVLCACVTDVCVCVCVCLVLVVEVVLANASTVYCPPLHTAVCVLLSTSSCTCC